MKSVCCHVEVEAYDRGLVCSKCKELVYTPDTKRQFLREVNEVSPATKDFALLGSAMVLIPAVLIAIGTLMLQIP